MAAIGCEEKGVGINSIELASNTHQMHCVGVASARGARALGSEALGSTDMTNKWRLAAQCHVHDLNAECRDHP